MPTRRRILCITTFDCALSGPFDNLFLTRLSASRALCRGIVAFISASTVCSPYVILISYIISKYKVSTIFWNVFRLNEILLFRVICKSDIERCYVIVDQKIDHGRALRTFLGKFKVIGALAVDRNVGRKLDA